MIKIEFNFTVGTESSACRCVNQHLIHAYILKSVGDFSKLFLPSNKTIGKFTQLLSLSISDFDYLLYFSLSFPHMGIIVP